MTVPMTGLEREFRYRIDALIFGDDGTVTVEYAEARDEDPRVLRGARISVPFDLSDGVTENYLALIAAANDLISTTNEAARRPPASITGGPVTPGEPDE